MSYAKFINMLITELQTKSKFNIEDEKFYLPFEDVMETIQLAGAVGFDEGFKLRRKAHNRIKVGKYSEPNDDSLIEEFDCITDAAKALDNVSNSNFRNLMRNNYYAEGFSFIKGFYWKLI
jgi:hypothetical protein